MPFINSLINGIKQQMAWNLAQRQDVGFGMPDQCPRCGHKGNYLNAGWYNPVDGTGKAQWICVICHKSWTWSRRPKNG